MSVHRRDFLGRMLCENCWNGAHYVAETINGRKTGRKFNNCLCGYCECLCRELLGEAIARRERKQLEERKAKHDRRSASRAADRRRPVER